MRQIQTLLASAIAFAMLPVVTASAQAQRDLPAANSLIMPQPATPPAPLNSAPGIIAPGRFEAVGVNPDGTTYRANVVIRLDGDAWRVSWLITSGDTFKGTGYLAGGKLIVDWGQQHPVIYEPGPNGTLAGVWANGLGKETLIPSR